MSHFFSTFINRSLLNVHYVRRLWEAASDTAFSAPNCWYSCSWVTTPSPQMWAGLSDSLWTNRIWHKRQDVTIMTKDCNLSWQHSLLVAFSCLLTCLLWRNLMPLHDREAQVARNEEGLQSTADMASSPANTSGVSLESRSIPRWDLRWDHGPCQHLDYSQWQIQSWKAQLSLAQIPAHSNCEIINDALSH